MLCLVFSGSNSEIETSDRSLRLDSTVQLKMERDSKERLFSDANFSHTVSVFKRPSYYYVFPVIFVYFLVIFGIFPLTTQIHIDQVCADLDEDDCDSSKVSARASTLNLLASLALSISSIITCGFYGSVADVYGRKYAMVTPFIGLMVYSAAYLYVDTCNPAGYLPIIVCANVFMGFSGSYFVFIMGALCYTSDATIARPETRRDVYSLAEATIMTPEVFGPVLTGIWATYYGFFVPLLLAVVFSGLAICYIVVMPESLPPDAHSRTLPLQLNPLQTFYNFTFLFTYKIRATDESEFINHGGPASAYSASDNGAVDSRIEQDKKGEASPLPHVGLAFLLYFSAVMGQSAVRIVYVKHRFGWDSDVIGVYDGMEGFVIAASMVFAPMMVQIALRKAKPLTLMTWVQTGLAFRVIHWCLFGLVKDTVGIFVLLPLLFFVGPMAPYVRAIMSNTVAQSEQAQIFSAFSALEGIAGLLAPLYSAGYTGFVQIGAPGLIFQVMALAAGVGLVIVTYVRLTPSLSKHIPEDHHHQFHGKGGGDSSPAVESDGEDAHSPMLSPVEDSNTAYEGADDVAARGAVSRRRSRSVSSTHSRTPSVLEDSPTLQFAHLIRPSLDGVSTSVDRSAGSLHPNTLTARLLAEPREDHS